MFIRFGAILRTRQYSTYGSLDRHDGTLTQGGYSTSIMVSEDFVLKVSETLDTQAVAPLLCAGITTYSPLRHWKVGKDTKVGVVGLGGLGHMAVKLAHAMGRKLRFLLVQWANPMTLTAWGRAVWCCLPMKIR